MTNCVMIGRGRLRLLKQSIESLYANTKREDFNLVFVSDCEDDFRCTKYLRSLTHSNFSLLEVQNSNHTLATLKNLGTYWSRQRFGFKPPTPHHAYDGDWLAIFDSDICLFPDWLPKMIDAMQRSDFGEGRRINLLGGCRHPFHGVNNLWGDEGYIEETDAVAGYSHFMRWSDWKRYAPLPRTCAPGIGQSEDFWLSRKIIESGNKVGYINPPVLAHCGITDSNGNHAIGSEQFVRVGGVVYE
jgi:hypothetical protein